MHKQHRLAALSQDALKRLLRGIEKESLRVTPDGALATTPHPRALGSALTHPHITTDFSESQLELITGVHPDADAVRAGARRDPPVRLPPPRRRDAVVEQHAVPAAGRRRHPARALRPLERRQAQDRVPDGPVAALRPADADDLGHPLQLFAAGGGDGDAAAGRHRTVRDPRGIPYRRATSG